MMNNLINDWAPETRALLQALTDAGFAFSGGDNGAERFKFLGDLNKFIADLTACDDARLYVHKNGKKIWLYLVYGNSPGELVSDYSVPSNADAVNKAIDQITEAHYNAWSNRKQPTKPSPYLGGAQ